jgi:carboxylesterase
MSVEDAPVGSMQDWRAVGKGANSSVGIIFVHGFTGSPISMRPWAEYFHERGYSVSVPLLPGHGTKPGDLNQVKWQEWPAKVEEELDWMHSQGMTVFIFGPLWVVAQLSMLLSSTVHHLLGLFSLIR